MRVSATVRSQSDKNRFCSAKLVNDRPLSALFWPYLTPASTFPLWRGIGVAGNGRLQLDQIVLEDGSHRPVLIALHNPVTHVVFGPRHPEDLPHRQIGQM